MNSIIVIMGQRPTWLKMLLSPALAAEYKRQIPAAKNPFCCCDCGASFHHMHMLANHIQTAHVEPLPADDENANIAQCDFVPLELLFSPSFLSAMSLRRTSKDLNYCPFPLSSFLPSPLRQNFVFTLNTKEIMF